MLNVHHTVRGYERAGAAGIQLEDQEFPKKCGHTPNRRVVATDVMVRKIGGSPLAHYTIGGYFGRVWWETPTALLMEANGRTQAAVVRCDIATCDRATDLTAPPDL